MSASRIHRFGATGLAVTVALGLSIVVIAAAAVLAPAATPAVTSVTTKTVRVTVGSRSFSARLSYPTRGGPYPALAFGHGYAVRASWYGSTLDALARAGFVVIAPDSQTRVADLNRQLAGLADDLNRSLSWLASESRAGGAGVPRGKVNQSRTAVAGHSMGGASALLAGDRSDTVDTVVTLAALPTPDTVAAARRLRAPSLFVVASDDRIIPPAATTAMFRQAPSPSLLASITGGSHCGFQDEMLPACGPPGRISSVRQRALTRDLLGRWLGRYLNGTPGARVTGVQGISYTQR
jgi:dienelactone hydrolase